MRESFVDWIGTLAIAPVPLAEVLQTCKARWPVLADYEDTALEGLLGLWSEIRVHRTSIFDAVVEFSRPELQTPEVLPLQAGLLQDRKEAGVQGAASPLVEREVSSPSPLSHPPQAEKKNFATAQPLQNENITKKQVRERRAKYKKRNITRAVQEDLWS